jgi:hypothetical protein
MDRFGLIQGQLIFSTTIWYIYGHLVYVMVYLVHFFRFGILYQEISGKSGEIPISRHQPPNMNFNFVCHYAKKPFLLYVDGKKIMSKNSRFPLFVRSRFQRFGSLFI